METKGGTVEREETGVYINFKMPAGSDMALPVAFVLLHLPAELVLELQVALSVHISVLAVVKKIIPLPC